VAAQWLSHNKHVRRTLGLVPISYAAPVLSPLSTKPSDSTKPERRRKAVFSGPARLGEENHPHLDGPAAAAKSAMRETAARASGGQAQRARSGGVREAAPDALRRAREASSDDTKRMAEGGCSCVHSCSTVSVCR